MQKKDSTANTLDKMAIAAESCMTFCHYSRETIVSVLTTVMPLTRLATPSDVLILSKNALVVKCYLQQTFSFIINGLIIIILNAIIMSIT
jgi:hypothetical protein